MTNSELPYGMDPKVMIFSGRWIICFRMIHEKTVRKESRDSARADMAIPIINRISMIPELDLAIPYG